MAVVSKKQDIVKPISFSELSKAYPDQKGIDFYTLKSTDITHWWTLKG